MRRCLLLAACLLLLCAPLRSASSALAATGPGGPRPMPGATSSVPDLAAMGLTPADLPETGYGAGQSYLLTPHELSAYGRTDEEAIAANEARFAKLGAQGGWIGWLFLPDEAGSRSIKAIAQQLLAYDTASHASQAFAILSQQDRDAAGVTELAAPALGDEAALFHGTEGGIGGRTSERLIVVARAGRILVSLHVIVDETLPPPEPEAATRLGQILLDRVARVAKQDSLALSHRALRLAIPYDDGTDALARYSRLAGRDLVAIGQTEASAKALNDKEFRGATSVFLVREHVNGNDDPTYTLRLHEFATEADAAAWLDDGVFLETSAGSGRFLPVASGAPVGEQFSLHRYLASASSGAPDGMLALFRVGTVAVSMAVSAEDPPSAAAMRQLAALQAACLTANAPCEPVSTDLILDPAG